MPPWAGRAQPALHGHRQAPGTVSALHKTLHVSYSSSGDFCGKFHWKASLRMENVCKTETDPFLIRESVGVEGCSGQNSSTNSA